MIPIIGEAVLAFRLFDVVRMSRGLLVVLVCLAVLALSPAPAFAGQQTQQAQPKQPSKWKSPDDGWLDISSFLDDKYGFVPVAVPITEPAIGFGAAVGISFVSRPPGRKAGDEYERTNMTAVAGLGTDTGTWGALFADVRYWGEDRVQTLFAGFDASINLDFHGTGETPLPEGLAVSYNLHPIGGFAQAKYRIGGSRAWMGLSYTFAQTKVTFDAPEGTPGVPDIARDTQVGGLTPSLTFDSRDTTYTPAKGTYVEASAGFYDSWLGGDDEFQKLGVVAMHFIPLHRRLTLGFRSDAGFTYGDAPFYMRPYVSLRGAPLLQFQRDNLLQGETEMRWQFWKRLSAVGFVGYGVVWNNLDTLERKLTVTTGGTGFRYELARRYSLHMGADVAWGPDGAAFYIQFGSAWMRP
jgi:hypothetical protein